jgi:hypothetical protein
MLCSGESNNTRKEADMKKGRGGGGEGQKTKLWGKEKLELEKKIEND